jgi:hypothetical protein
MMCVRLVHVTAFVLCLAGDGLIASASAVETALTGAWISGGTECGEVFSWTGRNLKFKKTAAFEPAFIIAGNQIRTPHAACRIKNVKPAGERRILTLACETAVASDEVPAILGPGTDGSLNRYFSADDTTGSRYRRCS